MESCTWIIGSSDALWRSVTHCFQDVKARAINKDVPGHHRVEPKSAYVEQSA
jgi:hypothetical protein